MFMTCQQIRRWVISKIKLFVYNQQEQKGETTSDETQRVYDHLGISVVGSSKDTSICSVENIPGYCK